MCVYLLNYKKRGERGTLNFLLRMSEERKEGREKRDEMFIREQDSLISDRFCLKV